MQVKLTKTGKMATINQIVGIFITLFIYSILFHNIVRFEDVFTFESRFPALFFLNVILLKIELH